MEELSAILLELLQKHYRVSLPGIGSFVVRTEPARIDEIAGTMLPPVKRVVFSKQETWNDGLLEAEYAARFNLSEQEAQERVRYLMMDIRFELDDKGRVNFPAFGCLRQGKQNSIELEQKVNLEERLGLTPVPLGIDSKNRRQRRPSRSIDERDDREIDLKPFALNRQKITLIVLAGLVGLSVTFILAFLIVSRNTKPDDLLTTKRPRTNKYSLPSSDDVRDSQTKETQYEQPLEPQFDDPDVSPTTPQRRSFEKNRSPEKRTTRRQEPPPSPVQRENPPSVSNVQYCIVITSVTSRIAAERTVSRLSAEGYPNCHIAEVRNGRYRVAIGCYRDIAVARRELTRTKQSVPDAWLLEKY